MKKILIAAALGSLTLAGCGEKAATDGGANGPAEKRQPGSWSQKIEIVKLEGPGVKPEDKAQMQQMMGMLSGMSICVTPEAAAAEDIAQNIKDLGSRGESCTVEKQQVSGKNVEFAATCKNAGGATMKMSAKGTSGATAQDITMTMNATKADGSPEGEMVMRIVGTRTGECKAGDITPPAPAKKAAEPAKS